MADPHREGRGLAAALGRGYRVSVTAGRWLVVLIWVALAVFVTAAVPAESDHGGDFGQLLPPDSRVLRVQQHILEKFRVPFLAGTTVVLNDPAGLTKLTQADSVLYALATTQEAVRQPPPKEPGHILAAVPVPTGTDTTAVTYLFLSEGTGMTHSSDVAQRYASHFNNQPVARSYVTGFVPAQAAQSHYLSTRIGLFEISSLILIVVVVAIAFRSLLAPLVVVAIAAIGYLIYLPLLSQVARIFDFSVPGQLEPVLLALLLGVITDYCVLFFSDYREELDAGFGAVEGARRALARTASVVAVAGLTVAGGTIALLAAPFQIFRALGPALAFTVLVGVVLCLTLTPAIMTIASWRLFRILPVQGSRAPRPKPVPDGGPEVRAGGGLRLLTRKLPALIVLIAALGGLTIAALPAAGARLDLSFTAGLPPSDEVAQGAQVLNRAGLRGITEPTEVMLELPGIAQRRGGLAALQRELEAQPGVARVIGPTDSPINDPYGIVLSEDGTAARFLVIHDTDPLAAKAVGQVLQLEGDLPALAERAGLSGAVTSVSGQSLIAAEVSELTVQSLIVTVIVAVIIELLILSLYLRAPLAAFALLATSVLSVAAALGLTTWVFQDLLGAQGLTFYAPFSAAVLLIALGSDYNVFCVGGIWGEGRRRPMREALLVAVPRSSRAITTAGAILAATFALVAIIPLSTFRQIAFAMAVGLLLDTFVARPILTPALLTLFGRFAAWPGRRFPARGPQEGP